MFRNIKNRVSRTARNEKGSVSMYVIIFMVFFLPFAIWVGVHLPIKFEATYSVKQMTSNTADSIISRLDQSSLANGIVWIDPIEAESVAKDMVKGTLNLNENWIPSQEGIINYKEGPFPFYFMEITDQFSLNEEFPVDKRIEGEIVLPREPGIYVYVLNRLPQNRDEIHFKGLLPIDNPSVIVHANIPVSTGSLFGGKEGTVITRTGVSEAQIHTGGAS